MSYRLVSRGCADEEEERHAAVPASSYGQQQDSPSRVHRVPGGKAGGPRIPQKRRFVPASASATVLYAIPGSVAGSSSSGFIQQATNANAPLSAKHTEETKSDRYDSGLGLEGEELKKRRQRLGPSSSAPRFLARGSTENDFEVEEEDIIERDNHCSTVLLPGANTQIQRTKSYPRHVATDSPPVMPSKSAPTFQTSSFETREEEQRHSYLSYDMNMDVTPSPKFDARQYQEHLLQLQQRAIEQERLQEGLSLLLPNDDGDTGLHQAVIHNQPNMISRLLSLINKYPQLRNSVDDQNSLYQTPLHLALHLQQNEAVSQLLQSGASILLQDHKGNTPLHIACSQANSRCLQEILNNVSPSDIVRASEIRNYEGMTCLHSAVLSKSQDALLRLVKAGAYIDLQDHHSGKTPLHLAVEQGSFQIIQTLVRSCSSDFDSVTFSGCTPLHFAAGHGRLDIVAYLVSLGADPLRLTDEGDSPYDLARDESVKDFLHSVTDIYYE